MTQLLSPPVRPRVSFPVPATLLLAAVSGLAAGAVTAWLQGALSGGWHVLADSGAVWAAVAFVAGALAGTSRPLAVATAALTLLAEVAGYYVLAAHALGFASTVEEQVLWTLAALWIGPLTGLAAHTWRHGDAGWSLASVVGVAGLAAGEGFHQILRVQDAAAGWVEVVAAAVVACVAAGSSTAPVRQWAAAMSCGAVVCAATYVAYGQTVLS